MLGVENSCCLVLGIVWSNNVGFRIKPIRRTWWQEHSCPLVLLYCSSVEVSEGDVKICTLHPLPWAKAFSTASCCLASLFISYLKNLWKFWGAGGSRTSRMWTASIIRGVKGRRSQNWHTWPISLPHWTLSLEGVPLGTAQWVWSWIFNPFFPWGV